VALRPVDESLDIVHARAADLGLVLDCVNQAAEWLTARGIEQWPKAFTEMMVQPNLRVGETWLARRGGAVVGTITLSWADQAWPEAADDAGYVHRLAVLQRGSGLGEQLLAWASQQVVDRGRRYLRLDCVATNTVLRRYYERFGFVYCGDVELRGPPGQRLSQGTRTLVSRFELPVPGQGSPS
jgi:GNAT superfamily N-acetyltransferase